MDTEITIIGAGVSGLATAARLSEEFYGIVIIEKNKAFGKETSSRNSEVIHSGIYYPEGSLKARLCVKGRKSLYDYCKKNEIPYSKCGKLIVATDAEEEKQLPSILERAKNNDVTSGRHIISDEVKGQEPNVEALSALHFPESGIVDSHGLMKELEKEAGRNGVDIAYNNEVIRLKKVDGGYEVTVKDDEGKFTFSTHTVINSAGLGAYEISRLMGIDDPSYRYHFWKGEYWGVGNGKGKLVSRLIYPVPETNTTGLGIHATVDLNGGLKLGPNTVYLEDDKLDYTVDKSRKTEFYESAKRFLPFLEPDDLHPDQAGIRPKLQKPGDPVRDFIIRNEADKGYPGFINLLGIESPGLTACLAIGNHVKQLIKG
ncbi:MAG: NAD(P)/FAD-dependent oxidoreductase [bacterium]